jgi:hypothetical protein
MSREGWAKGICGGYLVKISRRVAYDTTFAVRVQALFAARETYLCCDKYRLEDLVVTLLECSVFVDVDVDVDVGTVARLQRLRVAQTRSPQRRHRKPSNAMRMCGR